MQVHVYVCPTPGCGNYHGSSHMGDLASKIVGQMGQNFERRPESQWHSRAQCPDCRARGNRVERVLMVLEAPLETAVAVPPRPEIQIGDVTPPPQCPHLRQTFDSSTDIYRCDDCGATSERTSLIATLREPASIPPGQQS